VKPAFHTLICTPLWVPARPMGKAVYWSCKPAAVPELGVMVEPDSTVKKSMTLEKELR